MSIPTVRFGGTEYSLETLGNLSGPELVKLHNAVAAKVAQPETKRFSDKQSALKRTWGVLKQFGEQNPVNPEVIETERDIMREAIAQRVAGGRKELDGAEQAVPSEASEDEVSPDNHSEEHKVAAAKRKAPTKPAKKAAAEQGGRGFPEDAKIKILVKENPRRGAAAERFEIYKNGMTVAEFSKKIGSRAEALVHLRWDVNKGHISVG